MQSGGVGLFFSADIRPPRDIASHLVSTYGYSLIIRPTSGLTELEHLSFQMLMSP